jgi:hypothetical protein
LPLTPVDAGEFIIPITAWASLPATVRRGEVTFVLQSLNLFR